MKNTRIVLAVAVLVLLVGVWLSRGDSEYTIVNYPSSGETVVAFGDSLVYGVGADTEGGFVTMLSGRIGEPIVNLGRGGDTTELGLQRINDVLNLNPKVVIVLLGGNDYLSRKPREGVFKNLRTIVTTIQEDGAVVLLLGVRGGLLYDSYDNEYKDLARELGAAHVPNILDGLIGNSEFMDDAIHPSELGYEMIAERVFPVLNSLIN